MNESSPSTHSTLPSRSLQELLHNRIIQKKREIHRSYNRAYTDSLWTEIETLHWVLAQILTLGEYNFSSNSCNNNNNNNYDMTSSGRRRKK
jgi:hypothetical protein